MHAHVPHTDHRSNGRTVMSSWPWLVASTHVSLYKIPKVAIRML